MWHFPLPRLDEFCRPTGSEYLRGEIVELSPNQDKKHDENEDVRAKRTLPNLISYGEAPVKE